MAKNFLEKTTDPTSLDSSGPGHIVLDDQMLADLAAFKKNCDVMKLDLASTKNTLNQCVDSGKPSQNWWANPTYVLGGMAVSFSLGALLVFAIKD